MNEQYPRLFTARLPLLSSNVKELYPRLFAARLSFYVNEPYPRLFAAWFLAACATISAVGGVMYDGAECQFLPSKCIEPRTRCLRGSFMMPGMRARDGPNYDFMRYDVLSLELAAYEDPLSDAGYASARWMTW